MRSPLRFAVAAAALLVGACADESTAPANATNLSPLSADANVVSSVLDSPTAASLMAMGPSMDLAIGGSALVGSAIGFRATDLQSAKVAGRQLYQRLQGGAAPNTVADVIPQALTGRTLVFDPSFQRYVLSDRTGAPASGVRFVLYTINPLTNRPEEPLTEVGYADITRTATSTSISGRVEAFSGTTAPVKVMDYTATLTGVVVSPQVSVVGFAANGADRLEFTMTSSINVAQQQITINNQATVPTQSILVAVNVALSLSENSEAITMDGRIESPDGTLRISGGTNASGAGSYTVTVNGSTFATITFTPNAAEPTVVDAAGRPLTAEQVEALRQIFVMFGSAFEIFDGLSAPIGTVIGFAI